MPMLDHVSIQRADLDASSTVYDTVLAPLGIQAAVEFGDVTGYGVDRPEFWIGRQTTGEGLRGSHLAFSAYSRDAVRAFLSAAVADGAEVLYDAREWPEYHPDYYAAFVRDPDGKTVDGGTSRLRGTVCHTPDEP